MGEHVFEAWSVEEGVAIPGGDVRDRFTAYLGLGLGAVTRVLQDLPKGASKVTPKELVQVAYALSDLLLNPPEGVQVSQDLSDEKKRDCVLWFQISDGVDRAFLCGKALLFDERVRTLRRRLEHMTGK